MMITSTLPHLQTRSPAGIDLPVAGRWQVHPASFVGLTVRRQQTRLRLQDGWFEVGAPADDLFLLELRTDDVRLPRLIAWATSLRADANGFGRWELDGEVQGCDDGRRPLTGRLAFHGIFRRGQLQRAWLSGSASARRDRRPTRTLDVVLDLIAEPTTESRH